MINLFCSLRDTATEDDAGIGGILYRLEKERNMNLGFALKEIESTTRVQSSNVNHDLLPKTTKNGVSFFFFFKFKSVTNIALKFHV